MYSTNYRVVSSNPTLQASRQCCMGWPLGKTSIIGVEKENREGGIKSRALGRDRKGQRTEERKRRCVDTLVNGKKLDREPSCAPDYGMKISECGAEGGRLSFTYRQRWERGMRNTWNWIRHIFSVFKLSCFKSSLRLKRGPRSNSNLRVEAFPHQQAILRSKQGVQEFPSIQFCLVDFYYCLHFSHSLKLEFWCRGTPL